MTCRASSSNFFPNATILDFAFNFGPPDCYFTVFSHVNLNIKLIAKGLDIRAFGANKMVCELLREVKSHGVAALEVVLVLFIDGLEDFDSRALTRSSGPRN